LGSRFTQKEERPKEVRQSGGFCPHKGNLSTYEYLGSILASCYANSQSKLVIMVYLK
jgi:hypothetical protein